MKVLWRGLIPENVINYPDTKSYQHKTLLLPPSQLPLGARQIEGSSITDFHFTWIIVRESYPKISSSLDLTHLEAFTVIRQLENKYGFSGSKQI